MKPRLLLVFILGTILITACTDTAKTVKPTIQKDMKNAIRLKSRVFVPSSGLEDKLKDYIEERTKYERIHVIVQFDKVPSLEQRKTLEEKQQIKLLDPLPERAFYASIPRQTKTAKSLVEQKNIRWIGRIAREDRIASYLIKKGVPAHAVRDKQKAELIVEFFGDVSESRQKKILMQHNAKILNRIIPLNGWNIIIPEADINTMADEDEVKWIVDVPPPIEDVNDSARSNTGVNAESVQPPSIYGLSGAGITVAQWETRHASLNHNDFMARVSVGDPPVTIFERGYFHDESVSANAQYDNGEIVYRDMDDSGTVTAGDFRITPVATYAAGTTVAAGDTDAGTPFVTFVQFVAFFTPYEGYTDNVTVNGRYDNGDGIYLDNDTNGIVSNGDTRLTPVDTYGTGSVVVGAPADTDVGRNIFQLSNAPHYHATHVAGTVLGDGSQSLAAGGTANQWKGVAPGANLRSYSGFPPTSSATGNPVGTDEYADAALNGASISTNSWRTSRCYNITVPYACYETGSQYYDAVISGRRSDGTAAGLARQLLVVAAAGNEGRDGERYVDDTPANGQYDTGESIYKDGDEDSVVSGGDILLLGAAKPAGTAYTNFTSFEMHGESVSTSGRYENGEGIYTDADTSRHVSAGDTRITAPAASGYADGSVVAVGDTDEGEVLKWFRPNATLGIPSSSKNTLEVASFNSDTQNLSDYSSRGPSYDGRFKPDIAGPGCEELNDQGVTSTWPGNGYATICGTSMATPAVSGSAALLEEWYRTACSPAGPTPDILKALFIHSAEDMVNVPNFGAAYAGPDFAFGYGRLRTKGAVDLLPNYLKATAAGIGTTNYTVTIGVMETLKVTLVWDDPPWVGGSPPSGVTGRLQNDLNLLLIAPDGTQYTPWIADSTNLFAPAVRSIIPSGTPVPANTEDHLNNIEQVEVQNAIAGTWTIQVTASGMNLPPQDYILVSEALPPNATDCTANPIVDVWVKDNPSDTGAVPSTGAMYLSPDIWNRNTPDGLTDDTQQNPEYGQANYLYARVRNSSATESVKATTTDAWIGTLSLGLSWPEAFTHVGKFHIPNLAPGETRIVGPIEWNPPAAGHYCMYTRVQSPQDPITYTETTSVWGNANNSNNIAYRNMTIIDLASSKSVSFLVRNVMKSDEDVDVVIDIPKELLAVGEVEMKMSPELDSTWPQDNRQVPGLKPLKDRYQLLQPYQIPDEVLKKYEASMKKGMGQERFQYPAEMAIKLPIYKVGALKTELKGIHMKGSQVERMTLTFFSKQREKAVYNVHVTQKVKGKTVGGILFVVRTGYKH